MKQVQVILQEDHLLEQYKIPGKLSENNHSPCVTPALKISFRPVSVITKNKPFPDYYVGLGSGFRVDFYPEL